MDRGHGACHRVFFYVLKTSHLPVYHKHSEFTNMDRKGRIMKLIFLDIDGVLNNENSKAIAPSGCAGVDDKLTKNLASIIVETDAKIVLTSDWKIGWESIDDYCSEDAKYLNRKLRKYGMRISSKTYDDHVYDSFFEDRGKGIHNFLEKVQNVEAYVVIDDHTFTDFDDEIKAHLVLTDYRTGLTDSDAEKAIDILMDRR